VDSRKTRRPHRSRRRATGRIARCETQRQMLWIPPDQNSATNRTEGLRSSA
jgi:hypothetical protein